MTPSHTQQPDSLPFLLLRDGAAADDAVDEDAETTEIPASRSVPPHSPPPRVITSENELPSVIVELKEVEVAEPERASEVDGLLTVSERIVLQDAPRSDVKREGSRRSFSGSRVGTTRGLAIALVAALSAAGGTVAGMKVFHVSGVRLGAALHVVR